MQQTSIKFLTNAQNIPSTSRVAWIDTFPPSPVFVEERDVVSPEVTSPFTGRGGTSMQPHTAYLTAKERCWDAVGNPLFLISEIFFQQTSSPKVHIISPSSLTCCPHKNLTLMRSMMMNTWRTIRRPPLPPMLAILLLFWGSKGLVSHFNGFQLLLKQRYQ